MMYMYVTLCNLHVLFFFFLFLAAMLGTQLNDLVTSNQIEAKAVVQLDKYVCNTIQETR